MNRFREHLARPGGALLCLAAWALAASPPAGGQTPPGGAPRQIRETVVVKVNDDEPVIVHSQRAPRGYLGVVLRDPTPEQSARAGVAEGGGAVITDVEPEGPAARAQLRPGDLVTAIDGETVDSARALAARIGARTDGQSLTLQLRRDGAPIEVEVTCAQRDRRLLRLDDLLDGRDLARLGVAGEAGDVEVRRIVRLELDEGDLDEALAEVHSHLETPGCRLRLEQMTAHREELMERLGALETRLRELESELALLSAAGR